MAKENGAGRPHGLRGRVEPSASRGQKWQRGGKSDQGSSCYKDMVRCLGVGGGWGEDAM